MAKYIAQIDPIRYIGIVEQEPNQTLEDYFKEVQSLEHIGYNYVCCGVPLNSTQEITFLCKVSSIGQG